MSEQKIERALEILSDLADALEAAAVQVKKSIAELTGAKDISWNPAPKQSAQNHQNRTCSNTLAERKEKTANKRRVTVTNYLPNRTTLRNYNYKQPTKNLTFLLRLYAFIIFALRCPP